MENQNLKEQLEKTKQEKIEAQKRLIELKANVENEVNLEMAKYTKQRSDLQAYQFRCKTFGVNLDAYARLGLFLNAKAEGKNVSASDYGLELKDLDGVLKHSEKPETDVPYVEPLPEDHMTVHKIIRDRVLKRLGLTEQDLSS